MMNDIFQIKIAQGHVLIYLDDILIFLKDLNSHHCQVCHVMEIFWYRSIVISVHIHLHGTAFVYCVNCVIGWKTDERQRNKRRKTTGVTLQSSFA
jgi:hypothetical protein